MHVPILPHAISYELQQVVQSKNNTIQLRELHGACVVYQGDSKVKYTVVKENGCFLSGIAYEEVVDAVHKDATSCQVNGYTVHILEVKITAVDEAVVKVRVEGIDEH
jgi:hypothetical protein